MNVYQIVTDRIIAEPEKGIIPWERPWTGVRDGAYSRATGKPYSLLNQFLLGRPGEWLTYKQAQQAGGQVRKGEKGSVVVFWKLDAKADKDRDTGELKIKQFPILKYYYVFHISQGKPGRLEDTVLDALRNATWCASDPVCIQSRGQGPESLNLAACHSCALLPETCCECGNRLLDRGLVIGSLTNPEAGYFAEIRNEE